MLLSVVDLCCATPSMHHLRPIEEGVVRNISRGEQCLNVENRVVMADQLAQLLRIRCQRGQGGAGKTRSAYGFDSANLTFRCIQSATEVGLMTASPLERANTQRFSSSPYIL